MRAVALPPLTARSGWVRGLLVALFVSHAGTFMQTTAQAWLVWALTHSTASLALLGLVQATPLLGVPLLGGLLADRWPRRSILLATQSILVATAMAMAVLTLTDRLTLPVLLTIAGLLAAVAALDNPVRQVYLPGVVVDDERGRIVGLNALAYNLGAIIGPAIAGLVLATAGAGWCFLLNALSYLATIVWLLPGPDGRAAPAHRRTAASAWRFLLTSPAARRTLLIVALVSLLGRSYVHVLSAVVADLWGGGAGLYGTLAAFPGLGAVIAAGLVAWVLGRHSLGHLPGLGALSLGVLIAALGLVPGPIPGGAMLALIGLTTTGTMTLLNAGLQTTVPDEVRGRILSLYTWLAAGLPALGGWLLGTLMSRVSPAQTLLIAGGTLFSLALLLNAKGAIWQPASGHAITDGRRTPVSDRPTRHSRRRDPENPRPCRR